MAGVRRCLCWRQDTCCPWLELPQHHLWFAVSRRALGLSSWHKVSFVSPLLSDDCWWKKSGEPAEVGSLFHYLQGFIHNRWLLLDFFHQPYDSLNGDWKKVTKHIFLQKGEQAWIQHHQMKQTALTKNLQLAPWRGESCYWSGIRYACDGTRLNMANV